MRALATLALYDPQRLTLNGPSLWNMVIVFGSIQAMATFFFAWAALLWMTSGNNERNKAHAQGALYAALGGLALALLAQTISGLVNTAAQGQ
jgi:TorA maturation chaperone TorD